MTDGPWLLLKTKPSRERYAQENIHRYYNRETFLPIFDDDGKERVLFPSYLFILSDQWWFLKGAWGISHVVMIGSEPAKVSNKIVNELRSRQERDGLIHLPKFQYHLNQKLIVQDGPFQHFTGLYQGMDDRSRVNVLLDLFGRKVVVNLDKEQVSAA